MTPLDNRQHRLLDDFGPAIVAVASQLGQGDQHVELGQHGGRGLHRPLRGRHLVAKLQEQLVFQVLRLFVGREDFFFVFLQLRRDVTLGVLDRLLADEVVGHLFAMGVGHLQVVAKHLVVADLEVGDAALLGDLRLVAGDPLLAAAGQFPQGVEIGMVAVADKAAFAGQERAVVNQRRLQRAPQLGAKVDLRFQLVQQLAFAGGKLRLQARQAPQRAAQKGQVTRARPAGRDASQQPLDIVDMP